MFRLYLSLFSKYTQTCRHRRSSVIFSCKKRPGVGWGGGGAKFLVVVLRIELPRAHAITKRRYPPPHHHHHHLSSLFFLSIRNKSLRSLEGDGRQSLSTKLPAEPFVSRYIDKSRFWQLLCAFQISRSCRLRRRCCSLADLSIYNGIGDSFCPIKHWLDPRHPEDYYHFNIRHLLNFELILELFKRTTRVIEKCTSSLYIFFSSWRCSKILNFLYIQHRNK